MTFDIRAKRDPANSRKRHLSDRTKDTDTESSIVRINRLFIAVADKSKVLWEEPPQKKRSGIAGHKKVHRK